MAVAGSRWRWFVLVLVALVLGVATPAAAQSEGEATPDDDGPTVVATGKVTVPEGRTVDAVIIFDGPVDVAGRVDGPVIAGNGDIRVTGTVDEDVVAFNGRAIIEDGARVGGDVVSSDEPRVASGATVEGDVERVRFTNFFSALGWVLWLLWWLAVSVSTLVLGLLLVVLFPRAAQATVAAGRARVGPCIGWGLLLAIGLPLLSIALAFTLLGIPLSIVGLASMVPLFAVGFVAGALLFGRVIIREPRGLVLAFLVGWAILRVVDLIPGIGNLASMAATIYGLGAVAVAAWRATRWTRDAPGPGPAPAPAPDPAQSVT